MYYFSKIKPAEENITVEQAISLRRSVRSYGLSSIHIDVLGSMLWAGQGAVGDFRTSPSAGGQYPLEIYVVAHRIDALTSGIYSYKQDTHSLCCEVEDCFQERIEKVAIGSQPWLSDAAAVIVVVARISEIKAHFYDQKPLGKRGEHYAYIETGCVLQNMQLQGTINNIGCVITGGYYDEILSKMLSLPSELKPTAMLCVGSLH